MNRLETFVGIRRRGHRIFARKNFYRAQQVCIHLEIQEVAVSLLMRSKGVKFQGNFEINVSQTPKSHISIVLNVENYHYVMDLLTLEDRTGSHNSPSASSDRQTAANLNMINTLLPYSTLFNQGIQYLDCIVAFV